MRKTEPGFFNDRLKSTWNELERRFVECWRAENSRRKDPTGLLVALMKRTRWPTADDEKLAETIIQWLGTNIGICFLEEVLGQRIDRKIAKAAPKRWRKRFHKPCTHPQTERRTVNDHDVRTGDILRSGEQCGRCLRFRWGGQGQFETYFEGGM